jgi:hypothetical protein
MRGWLFLCLLTLGLLSSRGADPSPAIVPAPDANPRALIRQLDQQVPGGTSKTLKSPRSSTASNTNEPWFNWRTRPDSVDARISRQPLSRVLPQLARATGWQLFVEPGADSLISSTFRDLPSREALGRIFSHFNYALVPGTNGKPRLLVYRTQSSGATQEVAAADDPNRIDNEIVVRIASGSGYTAADLAKLTSGEVAGELKSLGIARLRYADADAADAAREKLGALEGLGIEDNFRVPNDDSGDVIGNPAGPTTLALRPAPVSTDRLVIGLIDSAVQSLGPTYDAFLIGREAVVPGAVPVDGLSHGTSMFGNLMKAAEMTATGQGTANFGVLSVDVYGPNDQTTAFDVAMGIQRAVEKGANVINMSLSSDSSSPFLHQVIRGYSDRGVLFIAAAGNEPIVSPMYPAAYPEVLAVTAGNAAGQFAPYANRGPFIDLMLPGSGVVPFGGDLWMISGTSTATAHASGIAGALWNPGIGTPAQLAPILRSHFGIKP